MSPQEIRLHLGCGEVYLAGYTNIDFPPSKHTIQTRAVADVFADVLELSYPPGSVSEVRMHHLFEHFQRPVALALLINWYRWLRAGGLLVIETPDFFACMKHLYTPGTHWTKRMTIFRHIFGSQEANWAVHYDAWDRRKFQKILPMIGFTNLKFSYSEWQSTNNIIVKAQKEHPFLSFEEQKQAAEEILKWSLVDDSDSESNLFQLWMDQFEAVLWQPARGQ